MFKVTEKLTETGTWVASTSLAGVDLPRTGWITEIGIEADITATLTATAVIDCTRRSVDQLTVEGDNKTFFGLSGKINLGTLLALINLADYGVTGLDAETDVGDTAFKQSYLWHPGSRPADPFDLTCAIPAKILSSLQLKMITPAAAVTDASGNITAGSTYRYRVNVVKDLPREVAKNIYVPVGYTEVVTHSANVASYGKEIDVPTGSFLRRLIIMTQDDTATTPYRKNDQTTGIKIWLPKESRSVIEDTWESLRYQTCRKYHIIGDVEDVALGATLTSRTGFDGSMHMPAGFVIIDFRDYVDVGRNPIGALFGLNLMGYQKGDVKLGLTIENYASGDATVLFWDLVQPMGNDLISRL